jgi:hypothetical protein
MVMSSGEKEEYERKEIMQEWRSVGNSEIWWKSTHDLSVVNFVGGPNRPIPASGLLLLGSPASRPSCEMTGPFRGEGPVVLFWYVPRIVARRFREESNSAGRVGPLPGEARALPSGRELFEVVGARSGFSPGFMLFRMWQKRLLVVRNMCISLPRWNLSYSPLDFEALFRYTLQ